MYEQIKIFQNKSSRGNGRDEQIWEAIQSEIEPGTGEKQAVSEDREQREVRKVKYRTKTEKPVVVDAFLYIGNLSVHVTDAPEWIVRAFISGKLYCEHPEDGSEKRLYMDTPDGDILIPIDSYIIRSEDGEIFYLKAMYFDDTYEPVPPEVDQEKKRQEFEEVVKSIHDWLCKYGDPYTSVTVMRDRATVHQEYMTIPLPVPD